MSDNNRPTNDLNRRPSRLLAAYTKAMERAAREALVPPHGVTSAPPVPPPAVPARLQFAPATAAATRTVPEAVAPRAKQSARRSSTIRPRRILVVCGAAILIAVVQTTIPHVAPNVNTRTFDQDPAPPIAATTLPSVQVALPTMAHAASIDRSNALPRKPAAVLVSAVAPPPEPTVPARARKPRAAPAESIVTTAPGDQWLSPRLVKLGIRASWRGAAVGLADPVLTSELRQALAQLSINRVLPDRDVVVLGGAAAEDTRQLEAARSALKRGGVLWVVLPQDPEAAGALEEHMRNAAFALRRRVDLSAAQQAIAFVPRSDPADAKPRRQS